jgi:hypothetical protein
LQLATAQVLAVQRGVALASTQALPQKPQCARVLVVSVSQASAGVVLPLHSPRPAVHGDSAQLPATQI